MRQQDLGFSVANSSASKLTLKLFWPRKSYFVPPPLPHRLHWSGRGVIINGPCYVGSLQCCPRVGGPWSLSPWVGDAFSAFICIMNPSFSLTFSLSAQRWFWRWFVLESVYPARGKG